MHWNFIKKQDTILAFLVMIVAVLSFLGFHYFFPSLDVQSDYMQEIISAFFGVFFATVLTIYLLNKQTESQQNKQKHQKVFEEKVKIFKELLKTLEENFEDNYLSVEKLSKLEMLLIKLAMIASEDTIKKFQELYNYIISDECQERSGTSETHSLIKSKKLNLLLELTSLCRQELGLSEGNLNDELSQSLNQLLTDWEVRGSYASYLHNKEYVLKLAECSDEEKEECFQLMVDVLKLLVLARKEGLFSIDDLIHYSENTRLANVNKEDVAKLEDEFPSLKYQWFKRWLCLFVDLTDPWSLSTMVEFEIIFGRQKGLELLKRYIGYKGIVLIQSGDNPIFVYDWMKSLFNKELQEKLNQLITKENLAQFLVMGESENTDEVMGEQYNLQEKRKENLPTIIEKFYLQNRKSFKSLAYFSDKQKESFAEIVKEIFNKEEVLSIFMNYEKDFLKWYLEKFIQVKYPYILDDYLRVLENYDSDLSVKELDFQKMDKLIEIISIIPEKVII